MNTRLREALLEKFEVIENTASDLGYILNDFNDLTQEQMDYKVMTRIDRILDEMGSVTHSLSERGDSITERMIEEVNK